MKKFIICLLFLLCGCQSIPVEDEIVMEEVIEEENLDDCYFFSQLSDSEKEIYVDLLVGIQEYKNSIEIDVVDQYSLNRIMEAIYCDRPELFWFGYGYSWIEEKKTCYVMPEYAISYPEIEKRQQEIDLEVNQFLETVPYALSDYEKIKAAYDYVVSSVEYVLDASDHQNIYSAFVNKKSVCSGYARALQYLLQKMDIECLYVYGEIVDGDSHAWNIVKCDGNYYHVDPTFGKWDFESEFPNELVANYTFLCFEDSKDRIITNALQVPHCTSNQYNYYHINGCFYSEYSSEVKSDMKEDVQSGSKLWVCQFDNEESYLSMLEDIQDSLYSRYVLDYLQSQSVRTYYSNNDDYYTIFCWY